MDRAAPPAPAFERSIHLLYVPTLCCNLSCSYCYLGKQTTEAALKLDAHLPPARLRRRKYLNTSLLIIDELGFEPMSRDEASLFFRLVTYRYGRGSILITTNKSVRDWTELLAGDEALTAAILDRLLHKAHVLNIKGRSYRLRDLEATLNTARH